ncbi:CU044_5270 family protein [Streptomyces sp. NPDC006458]|uniref:CU044_5270 family protein n=1 Tax=Streptomyces sp. NPDC006458 TaxID=3154302 RepID=UPI0033B84BA8
MDEMTAVRYLRSEAPVAQRPDLVPGRDRLLREAGRGSRRLRADWRLAAVGAAAITAVALIGTQVVGDGSGDTRPGSLPSYTIELGSAKDLLNQAADVIAASPGTSARAGQWVYSRTVETNLTEDDRPGPRTSEAWTKYADPAFENGRQGDDHSPREQYEFLRTLPDDVQQVRARARQFYDATDSTESRVQHEYRALGAVLARAYPYDPEGLAKVYRALASIPGVQAADVTDVTGRAAIALYLKGTHPSADRSEILLDPVTYLYRGFRYVATTDGDGWERGDAVISGARVAVGVVEKEGRQL